MQITAVLTAWLVLAAVLAASGVGKLRHPEGSGEAFSSLRVPAALSRPWMIRTLPWIELALAALLLTLPHPASVVTGAAALTLLSAYLLLVWRVVASGEEVTCHCFGSVGSGAVDGWTVARNVLLVLLGVVVLIDAVLGGSAPARFADLGSDTGAGSDGGGGSSWWWVAGLAVTAAVTYLVVRPGPATGRRRGTGGAAEAVVPTLRLPVPDVPVRVEDSQTISLRDLADDRPQLLLLLSPGCGPCRMISGHLPNWARDLPGVGFRVVHSVSFVAMRESLSEWEPFFVQDVDGGVARAFDDPARPWAVVLGTGGRIESAPAQGYTAIVSLVEELRLNSHDAAPRTSPTPDQAELR